MVGQKSPSPTLDRSWVVDNNIKSGDHSHQRILPGSLQVLLGFQTAMRSNAATLRLFSGLRGRTTQVHAAQSIDFPTTAKICSLRLGDHAICIRNPNGHEYTLPMKKYPLLMFDLDGTLVDSFPGVMLGLNLALADFDLEPVDLAWIQKHVGHGAPKLVAAASNGVPTDKLMARFGQRYDEVVLDHSPPFPGVDDMLRCLAVNHTLAIASNKPRKWVEGLVAHHGWKELITVVASPETAGALKPDPKMIEHIVTRTGHSLSDSLLVGDMLVDVETGLNAGVPVVGVATGAVSKEALREAGCSEVLERVTDLDLVLR